MKKTELRARRTMKNIEPEQRARFLFRQCQCQVVVVTRFGAPLGGQLMIVLARQLLSVFHKVTTDLHDLQAELLKPRAVPSSISS